METEIKDTKAEMLNDLIELRQALQIKSNEKDELHKKGMKTHGVERTELFRQANTYTKEITLLRKQINRLTRKLRR